MTGKVYLVGAGPGDPGMITVRGAACLAKAHVVLYDYLANPLILSHAPKAELLCVGKHGQTKIWTQSDINNRLIKLAQQGQVVVRLKGGDPAVFARGAEEAAALAAEGIAYEIVPGVTAALAAGSFAGAPITHRDYASAAALITGQEQPGKQESLLDYEALARFPGTLVFYMGVTTVDAWTAALLQAGKSGDTPALIVRRCSMPDQQSIFCPLAEVANEIHRRRLRPPAIVIVGDAVQAAPALSWFDKRPLFGRKVLVTRPNHQADGLADPLRELGAEVLLQPAIEISEPTDWSPVDAALSQVQSYDWLVFSSKNGVNATLDRLRSLGRDLRALGGVKLATVGQATADALRAYHLEPDLVPERFIADELAAALAQDASGKRFLLLRASRGREVLAETLTAAGAIVEQVVVYNSTDAPAPDPKISAALAAGEIDWVTVTSSAIARSLGTMFGASLKKTRLATISPQTTSALAELGLAPAAEATQYDMSGVVAAICRSESRGENEF